MNDTEIAENSKGQGSSLERMTQTRWARWAGEQEIEAKEV